MNTLGGFAKKMSEGGPREQSCCLKFPGTRSQGSYSLGAGVHNATFERLRELELRTTAGLCGEYIIHADFARREFPAL